MKKKIVTTILSIATLSFVLAGCKKEEETFNFEEIPAPVEEVVVPEYEMQDVTNLTASEAYARLQAVGFYNIVCTAYGSVLDYLDGYVVYQQREEAGSMVKQDASIELICLTEGEYLSETLVGKTLQEVEITLMDFGYQADYIDALTEEYIEEDLEEWTVEEKADWKVKSLEVLPDEDRFVEIVLSYAGEITMPDVKGKTVKQALEILEEAGFSNVKTVAKKGEEIEDPAKWKVVSQSVAAEEMIEADSLIKLSCSNGSDGSSGSTNKTDSGTTNNTNSGTTNKTNSGTNSSSNTNSNTANKTDATNTSGLTAEEKKKAEELEKTFQVGYAQKAVVVAMTNLFAGDVYGSDGKTFDTNKFHNFAYLGEYYQQILNLGTWKAKDTKTWRVTGMSLLQLDYGKTTTISCDVSSDGTNYSLSNVTIMSGKQSYLDTTGNSNLSLLTYDTANGNPFLSVSAALVKDDRKATEEQNRVNAGSEYSNWVSSQFDGKGANIYLENLIKNQLYDVDSYQHLKTEFIEVNDENRKAYVANLVKEKNSSVTVEIGDLYLITEYNAKDTEGNTVKMTEYGLSKYKTKTLYYFD